MTEAINWPEQPLVRELLAVCPRCFSTRRPTIVRTADNGDGSRTRNCVCCECSRPFKVVVEFALPETGKAGPGSA